MSTALVTGASAGIGRALAARLAHDGHDLVLVARDRARLERLATELGAAHGVGIEVLVADLADREQTEEVCRRLADPDRPVDVLVNNAGFGMHRPFLDNDVAQEEAALDVMVRAVLLTCHAAGRAMRERGHGAVLNVSSVAGFMAGGTYSAEKSFVTVFSESLASQLHGTGVTVTALCPGLTRTEFHERARMSVPGLPAGLWLDADEVARQALADLAAGRVLSVPGPQWKAASLALRALPRPLTRGGAMRLLERRRRRD
ncbi:SDR family NAD(P)-dependent oxidoreductase [Phycicoccus flavus]|uniref:SDR family oxidoreductase n=1 Tax=Phycicoccus flavus TaxID=2502783 RepID=A0A8T6R9H5_9MICO|nr:SDR family oxidoreductase [Phycicoccus flavus]NHA68881.1 SDR family oxidoreductase [Phycicoccus flavus]